MGRRLRRYLDGSLLKERDNLLLRLLGVQPRSGFTLSSEVPGTEVRLSGRHRFSRYVLVFGSAKSTPTSAGSARAFADVPGLHGRIHRTLVIGSRAHVLAVRGMLRAVRRSALTD